MDNASPASKPEPLKGMAEMLPQLVELPTLQTDPVLLGHLNKADLVYTTEQFADLCRRMLNGNPDNFFLVPYRDSTGKPKYARALFKAKARKQIPWAWDTIRGCAKNPGGIGFYPTNARGGSCWGALDFDAHDGDTSRARNLAFKAFAALLPHPQLYLVLCTSGGGGWHLFIFTLDFHSVGEWDRLHRNIAALIDSPIRKGLLEIFPDDSCNNGGNGIRPPGSWHPKTGECGLIAAERASQLLQLLPPPGVPLKKNTSLYIRGTGGALPRSEFSTSPSALYRGEWGEWAANFAITSPRSRHGQLERFIGHAFRQCGRPVALKNARLLYTEATCPPDSELAEHVAEFDDLWTGLERQWILELSSSERRKFDSLKPDTLRDAYRIVRNWSRADPTVPMFYIVAENLGDRLGVSWRWGAGIRLQLCAAGILKKVAEHRAHKLAACYEWIA